MCHAVCWQEHAGNDSLLWQMHRLSGSSAVKQIGGAAKPRQFKKRRPKSGIQSDQRSSAPPVPTTEPSPTLMKTSSDTNTNPSNPNSSNGAIVERGRQNEGQGVDGGFSCIVCLSWPIWRSQWVRHEVPDHSGGESELAGPDALRPAHEQHRIAANCYCACVQPCAARPFGLQVQLCHYDRQSSTFSQLTVPLIAWQVST